MTASNVFIGTEYTPETIKRALEAVFQRAAEAGIRVTILNGTIMLQRISGTWREPASINLVDLPEVRRWETTPTDATVDSMPGDTVRCPTHDAPTTIRSNDSSLVRTVYEDGDKYWNLDCGHGVRVRP